MLGFRRTPVNHPDPAAPRRLATPRSVVVVGGGIAGVAAALVLAERGAAVTLLESNAELGGRVSAWTDSLADGQRFEMERGFHAFFRQYYNLRALMRRIDPSLARLTPVTDYPLLGPDGAVESFAGLPKLPIVNLISLIRRSSSMSLRDALRVDNTLGQAMMAYDPVATYAKYDQQSAHEFLNRLGFPPRARQMLFDVFSHSFFNPEAEFSAAELMMMFHFYFIGNPEGIVFDVLDGPFSTRLWQPMQRHLEQLGVQIELGVAATRITRDREHMQVHTNAATLAADAVVLAPHLPGLQRIVADSPGLGDSRWRAAIAGQSVTNAFAVWRLWLDRPCAPARAAFVGTTGLGLLDNISLFHLFEDESRAWAARTGGSVVELHAYALPPGLDDEAIKADLLATLHHLYPETRAARIVEQRFLIRQDCPAFRPGEAALRPRVSTPEPGLLLAGDCVHTDFPTALMERAAATGMLAANVLLRRWGAAEEPLWSVVPRGLLARVVHRKSARSA
ncbi:FAD-dependent oxidoreductase [Nannocystis sp.]|uniref:FAD-dependent oxidoreductase n=1 Tax=Nannocystis sp. TaxID=1962667 RepID=UPI0024264A09|nr:FAD-dependent oxidoreductase [Nannocystis sp.]MBK7829894.1 FAD-dependent oxidoreductase [Nannocystis sp.]MBK9757790.1 FAD-dependent oxidoreductase [Nannocystis sp.]